MSIEIKNVNYLYSQGTSYEMHALKNVNLEIPDGQFVGLIGHTGSGKSTLTQHLNGLVKATSGHIYYNGEDIYDEKFSMKKLRSKARTALSVPGAPAVRDRSAGRCVHLTEELGLYERRSRREGKSSPSDGRDGRRV